MKTALLLLLSFLSAPFLYAQNVVVNGKISGNVPAGMRLYLLEIGKRQSNPDTIGYAKGQLSANIDRSRWQMYNLVTVNKQQQTITPLHIQDKDGKATLNLKVEDDKVLLAKPDKDNKALVAFNDGYIARSKTLWMKGRSMEDEEIKNLINSFPTLADSVNKAFAPSENVATYIKIWAALLRYESFTNIRFATGKDIKAMGVDLKQIAKETLQQADCPMATLFDESTTIAISVYRNSSLKAQLLALQENIKDNALREKSKEASVKHWLSTFDYQNHFDEGEKELKDVVAEFELDNKYVQEFMTHKSAVKAAPFPSDVKLTDVDGNVVNFSKFKGHWVYIDMWASWCVPCIKEIPYLKQLEKDMAGSNVAFVSISIDTNRSAWKKKMTQLELQGNQLINDDESLGKALNVNAIPRFLIYDPDGRLYDDNATRPSDYRTKQTLTKLAKP